MGVAKRLFSSGRAKRTMIVVECAVEEAQESGAMKPLARHYQSRRWGIVVRVCLGWYAASFKARADRPRGRAIN